MPGDNGKGETSAIGAQVGTSSDGLKPDYTIDEAKVLFPEMTTAPLVSGMIESGNPGVRLVSNDDKLIDMLKIIYLDDDDEVCNYAEGLAECDEFLIDEQTKKPNLLVLQRIEWIKWKLSLKCSKKGRFADAYKQAATGVLTNAMTESGWRLLGMPLGRPDDNHRQQKNQQGSDNGRRP